ncbi:MAG: COG2426 family protein [archaeon]
MVIFISFLPGIELRGSIPFGIALGFNPLLVTLVSVSANILLIPILFLFLNYFWKVIKKWRIVGMYVSRLRKRSKPYVDKYGNYGIYIFVAIPLPGSGVYTGSLVAWLFGMDLKDVFLPMALGVLTAALAIVLLSLGVISVL